MIRECIGEAAMWEQLAEEAVELAHAAQKMARVIRGENPTPLRGEDAAMQVEEEWTDVILCGMELGVAVDPTLLYQKQKRFTERQIEAEQERIKQEKELLKRMKEEKDTLPFPDAEEEAEAWQ